MTRAGPRARSALAPRTVTRPAPRDIFRVTRDEAYLEQLRAESAFWDNAGTLDVDSLPWGHQEYQNERLAGDTKRRWFEAISDFGQFKRGCVLGAGPGVLERYLLEHHPGLHLTVYDISGESLRRQETRLADEFPGRIEFRSDDFNFIELPENAYDLIVSLSSVHHVTNLEHLAFQINKSLRHGGYVFLMETVGESFYQFSKEKKRIFSMLLQAANNGRSPQPVWPDRSDWKYSPWECVRSEEILPVFREYMDEVEVRTANALLELLIFVEPADASANASRSLFDRAGRRLRREVVAMIWRARAARVKDKSDEPRGLLFEMDRFFSDTSYLQPGLALAIYGKRA
jgi:SAM-dependent methyltransferase